MTSNHYYRYKCPIPECTLRFCKRLDLRNHLIYQHNNIDLISECPICKQKFNSLKELKSHEKVHGEFRCKECGQKFLEKAYLDWHEKKHSTKREIFECEYCKKKFYYKGNLKEHIKNKHLNRTFKCFICDKELASNQKLKMHIDKKHQSKNDLIDISLNDADESNETDAELKLECEESLLNIKEKKHIDLTQDDFDVLQDNFL